MNLLVSCFLCICLARWRNESDLRVTLHELTVKHDEHEAHQGHEEEHKDFLGFFLEFFFVLFVFFVFFVPNRGFGQ